MFANQHGTDLKSSALLASLLFFAGLIGNTASGIASDLILKRTGRNRLARCSVVFTSLVGTAPFTTLSTSGGTGASVDQISEEAGFSRGAFYSNFADKEAIFLDLLTRHLDHEIEGIKRVAAESRTLEELIGELTASYRDLGQQPD